MLKIEKVHQFSDADKRNSFRAQIIKKELEEEYLFSSIDNSDLIEFCWLQGKKFYDIVPTGYASVYLVSDKVQSILKEYRFKGYCLRPIILKDKKREVIDGYKLLSIVSKVGPIINEKSIKKMIPPIVSWSDPYEAYIGLYFDISTWDGSHFFYPEGTSYISVVEEVKEIFEKNKITNCHFEKIVGLENYGIL